MGWLPLLFTHALATQLHPVMDGVTFAGGVDCVRSQRRINARQGEIRLLMDGRLRWQGQEWSIVKAPWMIKSGMMLRLRSDGGKRQHLWLAADSMDEAEWRDLRRILLQQETQR